MGERRSTWRETCVNATLSTKNSTRLAWDRNHAFAARGRRITAEPWLGPGTAVNFDMRTLVCTDNQR
jgi:hypothetical protein